ncbi:MAG: hypothetical protein ACOYXA_11135 [Bacteroidota bacterium]
MKKGKYSIIQTMFRLVLTLVLSLSITFIHSCTCYYGDQPIAASDAWITFVDRSSGNSVFKSPFSFPKDSLKIFNGRGELQSFEFRGPDNTILLYDLYDDKADQVAQSQELCKEYIFHFLYKEIDTITFCYLAAYEECDIRQFSYLNVLTENDTTTYSTAENIIVQK